jgi:hypothetical protein
MPTYYIEVITPLATFRSECKEAVDADAAMSQIINFKTDRACISFTGEDGAYVLILNAVVDQSVVVVRTVTTP